MQLFLKIFSVMANSIDPDQTTPSDHGLTCLHMPFCQRLVYKILGHLPYSLTYQHLDFLYLVQRLRAFGVCGGRGECVCVCGGGGGGGAGQVGEWYKWMEGE